MTLIIYPSMEKIIEYNLLALELIKVKKADAPKVFSMSKIREIICDVKQKKEMFMIKQWS